MVNCKIGKINSLYTFSEYGANWSWIPGLMVALSVLAILAVTIYIVWIFCEKRRVSKCSIINGQDPNTPEIIQYGSGFERCNIV